MKPPIELHLSTPLVDIIEGMAKDMQRPREYVEGVAGMAVGVFAAAYGPEPLIKALVQCLYLIAYNGHVLEGKTCDREGADSVHPFTD